MINLRRRTRSGPVSRRSITRSAVAAPPEPDLAAQRDRLTERFAVLQSQLGGLFYEMAIRDHIRMEVLIGKAAELQRLDTELGQLERVLASGADGIGGKCSACGTVYARGAAFCSQCAHPVTES
jgi:hypothetical protein